MLKFAKSYAAKDQAFAEAIIEKFLPIENNVDYKKMVTDCFLHRKKGGARRYGSSLDWTAIRKDIKRVLKQLDYLRQQQDGVTAAYQNSGGKRLAFFSRYANLLTDKQCAEMVDALFKSIQLDSRRAKTRDDYARVASGLHLLGLSCEKGKQQACRLAAQILRDNPKKPAFREEIGKYEY